MIGIVAYYKVLRKEYLENNSYISKVDREPRLSF